MTETSAAHGAPQATSDGNSSTRAQKFTVWHDGKKEELDSALDYLIRRDGPDRDHWSLSPSPPSAFVEAWFDGTKLALTIAPPPETKPEISKHRISRFEWDLIQKGKEAELWSLEEPEGYAAQEEAKAKAKEPKAKPEAKPAEASTSAQPHAHHEAQSPPAKGHR
jgi:hypothetical protein